MAVPRTGIRLAELVATLSLCTDLGLGQPMEHVMRRCLISLRLSEQIGLDEAERVVVYYTALLATVGCHVDAYEQAKWFSDDIAMKADGYLATSEVGFMLSHFGAGKPPLERARLAAAFLGGGFRWLQGFLQAHCAGADFLASRLELGDDVRASLAQSYELWDGKHAVLGLKGKEILPAARLLHLANIVEVFHRVGGLGAAVEVVRKRSGAEFDPDLVELFCEQAASLFADLDASSSWDMVIAAEPALQVRISDEQLELALEGIGDFIDIKSPFTIGHSRSVADLTAAAALAYGLPETDVTTLRRAALVHDFGRLGVSNGIWDKRGPLTQSEMERVRLHPYLSERMLAFSPTLAPLGAIAVQHHERLDGSGYPRGISGSAITPSGRLLAAADVYHAMTELRPHREARSPEEAAALLRTEVAAGRLDGDAVNAVLRAAGHRVSARHDWPADLTAREVEILKLVACGLSNKEIAERLVISRKTAGNHVEHIYSKIGVSKRAGAGLFAVQHGLMTDAYPQ